MRHNFIMLTSKLQREYLWFYISAKKGSVFKTIPEIHRKEIIRMELLNLRFSLIYKSKPKMNFFLGHPVYLICVRWHMRQICHYWLFWHKWHKCLSYGNMGVERSTRASGMQTKAIKQLLNMFYKSKFQKTVF